MNDHIGDDAALYALGMLDADERTRIDEHVAQCDACMRLLARAEGDVTAAVLAQGIVSQPQPLARASRRRAFPLQFVAGIAAALVLMAFPIGALVSQVRSMHAAVVAADDAMRVEAMPHRVAAFRGMPAHVMYDAKGAWYYVTIAGVRDAALRVTWMHDGVRTDLGTATRLPGGDVAVLYLPKSHRMDQLGLEEGGRIVGEARLIF